MPTALPSRFVRTSLAVLALLAGLWSPAPAAAEVPPGPPPVIAVAAVGDVMLGSDYPDDNLPPDDGQALLQEVKDVLARADIAFGNLEGPLCDGGVCTKNIDNPNVYAFRTPTRFAATLKDAGFTVMSLANNHAADFGPGGLAATKKALAAAGIKYSSKDGEVADFTTKGIKVGLVALTYGPPPRSLVYSSGALAEIEMLARQYDILIVSVHAGAEGRSYQHVRPGPEYFLGEARGDLVNFARAAIDRGADLVLGHGPHVPRALALYKNRLVAYSLGNFCTYKGMSLTAESGYAPLLWVELNPRGEFVRGRIISYIQRKPGGPQKDEQGRAARTIQALSLQDCPETAPLITAGGEILPLPHRDHRGSLAADASPESPRAPGPAGSPDAD